VARSFEALRKEYAAAFADAKVPVVAIEHVGSTSVPGLAAKPVIDCDIVVAEGDVAAATDVLVGLGFSPLGELGFQSGGRSRSRRGWLAPTPMWSWTAPLSLRNHRAVRDTLRARPELRDRYATVKKRLGNRARGIEEYGKGKNAVIQEILAAAGLTDAERASIAPTKFPRWTKYRGDSDPPLRLPADPTNELPPALRALANEAGVVMVAPCPSPEVVPPLPGARRVVLNGRAISVPFPARRRRFATVSHGHSRSFDRRTPYYRCPAARMVRMGSPQ
jgi:GrpB-like predicted nucleotidyltransferase (UPF0157 family)